MAAATLQSFNVFLTERLTAAAVDIYGFVERTITDYQEEVYRTKMENQRLQRLLDLVYKPEIRLHRADSRQTDLPRPAQAVCAQEQQQIQEECVISEAKAEPVTLHLKEEQTEPCTRSVEALAYSDITNTKQEENPSPDRRTRVTVGEQGEYETPHRPTQVGEHVEHEIVPQYDQLLPSALCTKKKNMFFCNICCQAFLEKAELKLHLAAHSTNSLPKTSNKTFTCFVCGRKTDTRSKMICHMRTHTGEKPFSCLVCGRRYKLKHQMKEHMRTHTGERPYSCYICGKSFNRSSNLRKHARIQHREDMPFKCAQCSQRFPLLVVFKQHMKTVHGIAFSV